MSSLIIRRADGDIRVTLGGAPGPRGASSGPLGSGSVTADTLSTDPSELDAIAEALGAIRADAPFESTFDAGSTDAAGWTLNGAATGKNFDVIQINFTIGSGRSGNGMHVMSIANSGSLGGQSVGGAMNGPGTADAVVGNRYEAGTGSGVVGARVGTGLGNGVEGRASSTATCSAGYFIKQNPVAGTAGAGPAVWALNDATNGEAFYARSASTNTDDNTTVVDRLNGTKGTAIYARITGGGARTALVRGGATHVVPGVASTGTSAVIGYDVQVSANVTGSSNARGLSVTNNATGGAESAGAAIVVDGTNTTNYGLFVNVANAATNFALYIANGIAYFAGKIRAPNLSVYADNAAAAAGGLSAGDFYRTATGQVMVVY